MSPPLINAKESRLAQPLASLKSFAEGANHFDRCDLCERGLSVRHEHLLDPRTQELKCSCAACAVLFEGQGTRWKRVPVRRERVKDAGFTDTQWASLYVPIDLAYFVRRGPGSRTRVFFPSPAGATEAVLPDGAWEPLLKQNAVLASLEEDVESLLVNRIGGQERCFRVSVDVCLALVGLIRSNWRGFSGGAAVWTAISQFFDDLEKGRA